MFRIFHINRERGLVFLIPMRLFESILTNDADIDLLITLFYFYNWERIATKTIKLYINFLYIQIKRRQGKKLRLKVVALIKNSLYFMVIL